MKISKKFAIVLVVVFFNALQSCSVWEKIFPPKYGCGTNGKNVGAEKLLDENAKGKKRKKAPKFTA
jgi:hypothetical protein